MTGTARSPPHAAASVRFIVDMLSALACWCEKMRSLRGNSVKIYGQLRRDQALSVRRVKPFHCAAAMIPAEAAIASLVYAAAPAPPGRAVRSNSSSQRFTSMPQVKPGALDVICETVNPG